MECKSFGARRPWRAVGALVFAGLLFGCSGRADRTECGPGTVYRAGVCLVDGVPDASVPLPPADGGGDGASAVGEAGADANADARTDARTGPPADPCLPMDAHSHSCAMDCPGLERHTGFCDALECKYTALSGVNTDYIKWLRTPDHPGQGVPPPPGESRPLDCVGDKFAYAITTDEMGTVQYMIEAPPPYEIYVTEIPVLESLPKPPPCCPVSAGARMGNCYDATPMPGNVGRRLITIATRDPDAPARNIRFSKWDHCPR